MSLLTFSRPVFHTVHIGDQIGVHLVALAALDGFGFIHISHVGGVLVFLHDGFLRLWDNLDGFRHQLVGGAVEGRAVEAHLALKVLSARTDDMRRQIHRAAGFVAEGKVDLAAAGVADGGILAVFRVADGHGMRLTAEDGHAALDSRQIHRGAGPGIRRRPTPTARSRRHIRWAGKKPVLKLRGPTVSLKLNLLPLGMLIPLILAKAIRMFSVRSSVEALEIGVVAR